MLIEEFDGKVTWVDGPTAHVTLTEKKTGDVLCGEYSAEKLASLGIRERRRFLCRTIFYGECVKIELEAVPDIEADCDFDQYEDPFEW